MLFEKTTPFLRFASSQKLVNGLWENLNISGYDHRIYYVLHGTGKIFIDDKEYELHPNSLIFWHSGQKYRYRFEKNSDGQCLTCNFDFASDPSRTSIPIPPEKINVFNPDKILEKNLRFDDNNVFNGVVYLNNALELRDSFLELVKSYVKKRKYFQLECNNILQKILLEIYYQSEYQTSKNTVIALRLIDYIDSHLSDPLTNVEIGAALSYHPNYLNSVMKSYSNNSLHQYVIEKKLHYAVKLLITTNKSISEIASILNLNDSQYFSRIFKKYYKITPSNFRNNK